LLYLVESFVSNYFLAQDAENLSISFEVVACKQ